LFDFRLRMYLVGRNVRWMVIALAAGTVWFGGPLARSNLLAVYAMLVLASLYNLALYAIPWKELEGQGRGNWVVIPYVVADSVCISIVVYVTGKIDSSFFVCYLLLVVWMAIYPGMRWKPLLWTVVMTSYFVAVFRDTIPTSRVVFNFLMRSVIFGFVAWLSNRISRELRLATGKLEHTVRDLTDGVVVLDSDQRVILINRRAADLMGVSEAKALGAVVADDPELTSLEPLRRLVRAPNANTVSVDGRQVRVHEVAFGEGTERVVRVYTTDYLDETDRSAGELKVLHDVTDLKQLERLRADVMSAVTHDLRNPLESIKGILALLRRRLGPGMDDDGRHWFDIAESESARLMRLTGEMLDLARLEAGKLQLRRAPLALYLEVESVVQAMARQAREEGIELTAQIDHDLPPVHADQDRLARVIYNLVENAIKFTPRGGSVRVTGSYCSEDGRFAQVRVSDTGPGIDTDKLETVFDRFVQTGDELWHKRRGAGLGLPICRDLVSAHGGQIWASSKSGEGSTFHFTLPFAPLDGGALPASADQRGGHSESSGGGS